MCQAKTLKKLKTNTNDECFTLYQDIEAGIQMWLEVDPELFKDQTILCPCDTDQSQFTAYFIANFKQLGLKKLFVTSYNKDGHGELVTFDGNTKTKQQLKGNGDFRSDEIKVIKSAADWIITNPPFSLFRDFVSFAADKKFITVAPRLSIGYKDIFPLIRDQKLFITKKDFRRFTKPDGSEIYKAQCHFLSNIDPKEAKPEIPFTTLQDLGSKAKYIDGTKILYAEKMTEIPIDYPGEIAAPITLFLYDTSKIKIHNLLKKGSVKGNGIFARVKITIN